MLTPFALSGLFAGLSSLLFGTLVLRRSPDPKIGRIWFLFTLSCALWGFGVLLTTLLNNPSNALWTWRTTYAIGANWIAPLFLHFVLVFTEAKSLRAAYINYGIAVLVFIVAFTPLHYSSVRWFHDSLYCVAGPTYIIDSLWWNGVVIYSHILLLKAYNSVSALKKVQIKFFFMAMTFGFLGGVFCFLPPLGIDIYPWGNFTITLYPFLMAKGILRHRLMDIGIVARDALTKILALVLMAAPLLVGRIFAEAILTMDTSGLARTIATLGVSIFSYSIAILFLRHYEEPRARRLTWFLLLLGTWNAGELILDIPQRPFSVVLYRAAYAIGCLVLLAWFEYWHAYLTGKFEIKSRVYTVIRVTAISMMGLCIATPYVLHDLAFDPTGKNPAFEVPGPAHTSFAQWFVLAIIWMGIWTIIQLKNQPEPLSKASKRWIFWSFAFGMSAATSYFCYVQRVISVPLHAYLEFALCISLLGSMLSLLKTHAWANKPISMGLGATSLTFPFAAGALMTQGATGQVAAGVLLVLSVPKILKEIEGSIQDWVDVAIFQGRYSYLKQLGQIRNEAFRYINLRDMLTDSLDRVVRALELKRAAVYLHNLTMNSYDPMVEHPDPAAKFYPAYSEGDTLLAALKKGERFQLRIGDETHYALPLTNQERLYGFFLLGQKGDGRELQEHDLEELGGIMQTLQQVLWYTHVFYDQSLMLSKFTHDNLRYANNIRRTIEVMAAGVGGPLNPQMKRFSEIIDGEATLLEEYLNDLRQSMSMLSQRLRGAYVQKEYDLTELLRQLLNAYKARAIKQKINLVSNIPNSEGELSHLELRGWGELRSIRHAIENLVANAFKFTPSGGTIRVEAKSLGELIEITVNDTGPGIPDAELPHIFDLFYQGKGREYMQQSTGLGLAIVKEIVAIHHGNIDVESEEGNGTTFYVRLPSATSKLANAA